MYAQVRPAVCLAIAATNRSNRAGLVKLFTSFWKYVLLSAVGLVLLCSVWMLSGFGSFKVKTNRVAMTKPGTAAII